MPRRRTSAGGHPGPVRKVSINQDKTYMSGFPGMPQFPRQPKTGLPSSYPADLAKQTIAEVHRSDRYLAWAAGHFAGSAADFLVHDYLQYQKRLDADDFRWKATISGVLLDYYIIPRQMGWNLTYRQDGLDSGLTEVSSTVMRNAGLRIISIHIDTLHADPQGTLDAAWMGIQKL